MHIFCFAHWRRAKDSEQACSSETSNSEILEVNELETSSGDTLTESIITPRGSLDLSVDDEFGGPSLLINDVLIPLSIENKNSPQFELCFKVIWQKCFNLKSIAQEIKFSRNFFSIKITIDLKPSDQ